MNIFFYNIFYLMIYLVIIIILDNFFVFVFMFNVFVLLTILGVHFFYHMCVLGFLGIFFRLLSLLLKILSLLIRCYGIGFMINVIRGRLSSNLKIYELSCLNQLGIHFYQMLLYLYFGHLLLFIF